MNPKFVAFVSICSHVLVFIIFLFCAFGLSGCLDVIGTPPECSDVQLAYFGVGLLIPCLCFCLDLLLNPLVDLIRTVLVRLGVNLDISRFFRSSSASSRSDPPKDSPSSDPSCSSDSVD